MPHKNTEELNQMQLDWENEDKLLAVEAILRHLPKKLRIDMANLKAEMISLVQTELRTASYQL